MPFEGNGTRFTGDDGLVERATFGAEVEGDGATALPVGTYMIIRVAGTSAFPAPASGGSAVAPGDILRIDTGVTVTPAADDDVVTLNTEQLCDISSFTMPFTKDEIEVTTLCDTIKKYRTGKPDMSGTINGIFTAGTSDESDGFLRQFIRIIRQDGATSADVFEQQDSILLGSFYVNDDTNVADRILVIAPFQLYGFSLGGEIGSPQSFSGNFRFAPFSYTTTSTPVTDISMLPTFYRWGTV